MSFALFFLFLGLGPQQLAWASSDDNAPKPLVLDPWEEKIWTMFARFLAKKMRFL